MKNTYFDISESLYEVTEKHPEAIELLISLGFDNIKNKSQRESFGKAISLEKALEFKKIDIDIFTEELIEKIEANSSQTVFSEEKTVKIAGVLPCPVKFPLLEAFEKWSSENSSALDFKIDAELKAASNGVEWIVDSIKENELETLPDIFISAGFELFFDKQLFGKYKSQDTFEDITGFKHYNSDFDNEDINLRDPDNEFSMLAVVPAVFLVNTEELQGRKAPCSWAELLSAEFFNSVSLPISDFDLFNSLLLNIYMTFGEDGIVKLGKIMKSNMHPSEMVKSYRKSDKPAVTIMPYFFTKMIRENDPMVPVWPSDGAIISPIFMLSKKSKKHQIKPIVDFFASKEVGEILSHNGRFPSVNPEVENNLEKNQKFMWLGWDFIKSNDISELIKKCEDIFNKSVKGEI